MKEPPPRDRLLTEDEKERLWKELQTDYLMNRLCVLAVNLPLRRGQILAITTDAVDLQNGLLLAEASKGRTARPIPLNSTAIRTLHTMIQNGEIPFPLKETGIRKRWVKILKRAKIENFRFHDLRREFASSLIRENVNPETVRQLFGHSALKITQVYMTSHLGELKKAVDKLDGLPTQESDAIQ